MARSSSALLVTLLSVAALMCVSAAGNERLLGRGGYNGPGSVTDILASTEFQVAAGKAWKESFLARGGYNLYQERGGWVYADSNNPDINLVVQLASSQRSAQATQNKSSLMSSGRPWDKSSVPTAQSTEIQLDNPEKEGVPTAEGRNYKLVADFHTLPFPGQERPDSDDVRKAYERGVPAIVMSCTGVFYYGPTSRASFDGPAGYPQTSSQQYKGQKEVRFGDNTVDSEGRCKP